MALFLDLYMFVYQKLCKCLYGQTKLDTRIIYESPCFPDVQMILMYIPMYNSTINLI